MLWKDITFNWNGEDYSVKPSLGLINKIEQEVGLFKLAQRLGAGDVPVGHGSHVIWVVLNEAGIKVTKEEAYSLLILADTSEACGQIIGATVGACLYAGEQKQGKPVRAKAKR